MGTAERGFSLTESVVVLAVIGTLLAATVTTVGDMIQGLRLQAVSADVLQHLMLARSEAIKRNGRVVLCKSTNGITCADQGTWEQGWILFQDADNSGRRDPNEVILERVGALPPGWRLTANSPLARYVSYGPFGHAQLTSHAFQAGTFTVCRMSATQVEGRQIVINTGGRPRMQKVLLDHCF